MACKPAAVLILGAGSVVGKEGFCGRGSGGSLGHLIEAIKKYLRPGFHLAADGAEFVGGHEGHFGDHLFTSADVSVLERPQMDDTEVHLADVVGVVVEQGDDVVGMRGGNGGFFSDFATDGLEVGVAEVTEERHVVNGVDVAADADGAVADEAGFTGGLPRT